NRLSAHVARDLNVQLIVADVVQVPILAIEESDLVAITAGGKIAGHGRSIDLEGTDNSLIGIAVVVEVEQEAVFLGRGVVAIGTVLVEAVAVIEGGISRLKLAGEERVRDRADLE